MLFATLQLRCVHADTPFVADAGGFDEVLDEARLARDYRELVTDGVVALPDDWGLGVYRKPRRWWRALEHRARRDGLRASGSWAIFDDVGSVPFVSLDCQDDEHLKGYRRPAPRRARIADLAPAAALA